MPPRISKRRRDEKPRPSFGTRTHHGVVTTMGVVQAFPCSGAIVAGSITPDACGTRRWRAVTSAAPTATTAARTISRVKIRAPLKRRRVYEHRFW